MKKINSHTMEESSWSTPKGTMGGAGRELLDALGCDSRSTDLSKRGPFAVEILRVPPGKAPYPYHSHSAQWEFYHVISGHGQARHEGGKEPIGPGDAFVFKPGEPHQLINDGTEDLIVYVVADNPMGESAHYPDSGKWLVRSPERRIMRSENLDYLDGEE